MKYRVYADRLKLFRSCDVPKERFSKELNSIRNLHPGCNLWRRTDNSLRREWAAHNLAYSLGIRSDKTTDCDLDYEQKWYVRLAYWIVGSIALIIIK